MKKTHFLLFGAALCAAAAEAQTLLAVKVGSRIDVTVDGAKLTDVHSVSVDYIKGIPLLFACVADVGREQDERREPRILH